MTGVLTWLGKTHRQYLAELLNFLKFLHELGKNVICFICYLGWILHVSFVFFKVQEMNRLLVNRMHISRVADITNGGTYHMCLAQI